MGDFSADRAITAGFRLIGREPLAFLAWILAYLVIGIAPHIGFFVLILPEWTRFMQAVAASAAAHSPMNSAEMMRAQFGMMQLQPLLWLVSLASHTLLFGAIYRAVLFPEDRRFFYLRLSGRELWLGLVMLVLLVMAFLLMIVVMIPTAIVIGLVSAMSHDSGAAPLLIIPALFAALAVIVWVLLRLSMATPMSFAQRGFRLYESWDLTRGQAGKMFLVALVFVIIAWVAEMILGAVILGLVGGFAGLRAMADWAQQPRFDLATLAPWLAGGAVVLAIFSTAFVTLFAAGWAEIYRELTAAPDAAPI